MAFTRQWYTERQQKYQYVAYKKFQNATNTINFLVAFKRGKRISINLDAEVSYIADKFRKSDYPLRLINIVNGFIKSTNDLADSYIIPLNLF